MAELVQTPEELVHLRSTYVLRGQYFYNSCQTNNLVLIPVIQRCSCAASPPFVTRVSETYHRLFFLNSPTRSGGASKALAHAIEEGLISGPRLIQCGRALSQTGT